jgi:LPS export ABC transporter permease LptF/LPS export ABC transporter permease LptG
MSGTRLNRIFYKEVVGPCLITLLVLTFVVFTREFGRLAEMLIRRDADAVVLARIVAYILPSVLIFSVPFSFLIGTLIAFSRLSGDSEIVAMKASGVSTWRMLRPILKIALLVALLTGVLTISLLPEANWRLRQLSHELGYKPIQSSLKPRIFNEDLPNTILYVEDIDLRNAAWKGVFVHTSTDGVKRTILADHGEMLSDRFGRRVQLHLEKGSVYETREATPESDSLTSFATQDVLIELPDVDTAFSKPKRPKDKNPWELWSAGRSSDPLTRKASLAELHGRLSLPLAPLIFAVLAVTLGIGAPRGGRGYGFITSIIVAFSYYILFDVGRTMASQGAIPVWLGGWGADIFLSLIAALTFWAASRDRLSLTWLLNNRAILGLFTAVSSVARRVGSLFKGIVLRAGRGFWNFCALCIQMTRVIDLYMLRSFLFYLAPTLITCMALFYLFTFFELMDDIFANDISYRTVLDYFLYLAPHILILLVPISVLIATLVTFGVMDKTNQVVAFKSCGVSVYRIAIPVVLTSAAIGAGLFVMQEHVSPYANQKQDSLRNVIKGRPAQTFFQLGRNWIFGEDGRLFNYKHFDSERDVFAEISIYDLDITHHRLIRHIYAKRARWDPATRQWILSQGWRRDFEAAQGGDPPFETFSRRYFALPERPSYFEREVKESSKMTFGELKEYITGLQRAGFEVDQLKTELYKKFSFPVVNLIMTLIGIPFAFSMGRKGALYGVAVGVVLGIFYWGAFGAFGVMGANGLLAPVLAAWGPNLLFGAAGLLMISSVRT